VLDYLWLRLDCIQSRLFTDDSIRKKETFEFAVGCSEPLAITECFGKEVVNCSVTISGHQTAHGHAPILITWFIGPTLDCSARDEALEIIVNILCAERRHFRRISDELA